MLNNGGGRVGVGGGGGVGAGESGRLERKPILRF